MKMQIYGSGCDKCRKLAANAETAARKLGIEIELEKVSDINAITDAGVMMTPALAINGKGVSYGKVLSPEEIGKRLTAAMTGANTPCCCAGSPETTAPDACCCSSAEEKSASGSCCGGSGVSRKILTVLLLALILFSIAAIVVRELNSRHEDTTAVSVPADAVVVYYFHGTQRCMTCNRIEELTKQAVQENFADQLADGKIVFRSVNVDDPAKEHYIRDFQLSTRTVVMQKGDRYEKFDQIWNLVREPEQFMQYIGNGLERMLK